MTSLSIEIGAPIELVWDYISNIESHTSWMADARSIISTSDKRNDVDATYLCDTKLGPLSTQDRMRVLRYDPPFVLEIEHVGSVTGSGEFRLERIGNQQTKFVWEERLSFPWYMGAGIGKFVGMLLLHRIWKRNLIALKAQIESMK